jgi:putative transposase
MRKSFVYRAYPSRSARIRAENALELCRQLYNNCLEERKSAWDKNQQSISRFEQAKTLPILKKDHPEFGDVPSQTLQEVVERLDKSFQNFFRRVKTGETPGYPRFKAKDRYHSLILKQAGWTLKENKLVIKKFGLFRIRLHRPIQGTIKNIAIKKSVTGKWYAIFSCENVPLRLLPISTKAIGLDVGCIDFVTDSESRKVEAPRFMRRSAKRLKALQQHLARQIKGSQRRTKIRQAIGILHEHISSQRKDFLFKVANFYVRQYGLICIEKLHNWKTFRSLNRSMRDASWFNFFEILRFKAEEAGRQVIEVPARDTSQICSGCGEKVPKELSQRLHDCPHCHTSLDRDVNAALNILRLGTSLQHSALFLAEKPLALASG